MNHLTELFQAMTDDDWAPLLKNYTAFFHIKETKSVLLFNPELCPDCGNETTGKDYIIVPYQDTEGLTDQGLIEYEILPATLLYTNGEEDDCTDCKGAE